MILVSLSTGGELGLPSQPGDLRVVGIVLWQLASTRECFKRSKVKALALLRPGLRDCHGSSLYWSKPFTVSGGVVVGNESTIAGQQPGKDSNLSERGEGAFSWEPEVEQWCWPPPLHSARPTSQLCCCFSPSKPPYLGLPWRSSG